MAATNSKLTSLFKRTVQLSENNFHEWKTAIQDIGYTESWPEELTSTTDDAWDQKEDEESNYPREKRLEAYQVMLYSIPQSLRYLIIGTKRGDAKAIFHYIFKRFVHPDTIRVGGLPKEFWSLTMSNTNLKIDKFISEVIKRKEQLNTLNVEITEQDVLAVILSGATKEFAPIMTVLEADDTPVTGESMNSTIAKIFSYARKHHLLTGSKAKKESGNLYLLQQQSNKVCRFFQKHGKCRYQNKCKYQHILSKIVVLTKDTKEKTRTNGNNSV